MEKLGFEQGHSDGGYIGYIPPKSVYLINFYVVTGCLFLFDPGQIRYRASELGSLLAVLFTRGTLTCFDFEIGMTS